MVRLENSRGSTTIVGLCGSGHMQSKINKKGDGDGHSIDLGSKRYHEDEAAVVSSSCWTVLCESEPMS